MNAAFFYYITFNKHVRVDTTNKRKDEAYVYDV